MKINQIHNNIGNVSNSLKSIEIIKRCQITPQASKSLPRLSNHSQSFQIN